MSHLYPYSVERELDAKLGDFVSVHDYGAMGDGTSHPLSERYATLEEAQAQYPCAATLNDEIDWCAIQMAIESRSGVVYFDSRRYYLNKPLDCANRTSLTLRGKNISQYGETGSTVLVGNTGGWIIDAAGATYLRVADMLLFAAPVSYPAMGLVPNPARGGILFGRTEAKPYSSNNVLERVEVFLDTMPGASIAGTVGVHNCAASSLSADGCYFIADTPALFCSTNILNETSPNGGELQSVASPVAMSMCALRNTFFRAWTRYAVELYGAENFEFDRCGFYRQPGSGAQYAIALHDSASAHRITGQVEDFPAFLLVDCDAVRLDLETLVLAPTQPLVTILSPHSVSASRLAVRQLGGTAAQPMLADVTGAAVRASTIDLATGQSLVLAQTELAGCLVLTASADQATVSAPPASNYYVLGDGFERTVGLGFLRGQHVYQAINPDGSLNTQSRVGVDTSGQYTSVDTAGKDWRVFTTPVGGGLREMLHVYGATTAGADRLTLVGADWFVGTGVPEGVLTAGIGARYTQRDGAAGSVLWVKETATGASGWRPLRTLEQTEIELSTGAGTLPSEAHHVHLAGGGPSPVSGSFIWGDGSGWELRLGTRRNDTFTARAIFADTGAFTLCAGDTPATIFEISPTGVVGAKNAVVLTGGAAGLNATPNSLVIGGGGNAPTAARAAFGDGTGWQWHVGANVGGAFRKRLVIYDTGKLETYYGSDSLAITLDPNNGVPKAKLGNVTLQDLGSNNANLHTPNILALDGNVIFLRPSDQGSVAINLDALARTVDLPSAGALRWRDHSSASAGAVDVGLVRQSAGVLEINNGVGGQLRHLRLDKVVHGGLTTSQAGTGSPEGVVSAPVGSIWYRSDGGPGAALYVKETGAGTTGWRSFSLPGDGWSDQTVSANTTITAAHDKKNLIPTVSCVLTLPVASATFENLEIGVSNDYGRTVQIRPTAPDAIARYGRDPGKDLVLWGAGDRVRLKCVQTSATPTYAWVVTQQSGDYSAILLAPSQRKLLGSADSIPPDIVADNVDRVYKRGDIVWLYSPGLAHAYGGRFAGWICTTDTDTANKIAAKWAKFGALVGTWGDVHSEGLLAWGDKLDATHYGSLAWGDDTGKILTIGTRGGTPAGFHPRIHWYDTGKMVFWQGYGTQQDPYVQLLTLDPRGQAITFKFCSITDDGQRLGLRGFGDAPNRVVVAYDRLGIGNDPAAGIALHVEGKTKITGLVGIGTDPEASTWNLKTQHVWVTGALYLSGQAASRIVKTDVNKVITTGKVDLGDSNEVAATGVSSGDYLKWDGAKVTGSGVSISDVAGLQSTLDNLGSRLSALESHTHSFTGGSLPPHDHNAEVTAQSAGNCSGTIGTPLYP